MDDITMLQECMVKVEEIKEELWDTFKNVEHEMPEKNSDEVNPPVAVLLQPKVEMEEAEEQAEELKPVAAVYIKTEVEMDEETEEQDHLADYSLAGCEEWDVKHQTESLVLRVKEEKAAEPKEEEEAGISYERSEQAAAEKMKDGAEEGRGRNEEHQCSKPESEDVPTCTNELSFAFACPHCSGTIRYNKTLEEHEREHQEEPQLLTCDACQRQFKARIARVHHTRAQMHVAEKVTKFPRETCGKELKLGRNLKEHLRVHTGEKHREESQLLQCKTCQRKFTDQRAHVCHTRTHINESERKTVFLCEICGKEFKCSANVLKHVRVHSGEKPFVCDQCGKSFTRITGLNEHLRMHTGEKETSECTVCGNSYMSRYMNIHMRTHTGEKPYKCRFCETTFTQNSSRLRHEEMHSDRKAIQCKVCGKTFLSTRCLKTHMRLHTGQKPYKCGYCDKTFAQLANRKTHEVTHTKEYPYNCAECGKGYVFKGDLVKHLLRHGSRKSDVKKKRKVS